MSIDFAEVLAPLVSWRSSKDGKRYVFVKERKDGPLLVVPVHELDKYPYFFVRYWFPFLHVDVDDAHDRRDLCDPGFYDHLGVPLPCIVVLTDRGVHVLYILAYPVARQGNGFSFLRNIRTSMIFALNGDFGCRLTCAIRNPAYTGAEAVFFGDWRYELAKLDLIAKRTMAHLPRFDSGLYVVGNRNRAVFAFLLSAFKDNSALTFSDLMSLAEAFQSEQAAPPLSGSENRGICASILRNGSRYSVDKKVRGILGLPPREGFMPREAYYEWRADRQAQGARHATLAKTSRCRDKVASAITALTTAGDSVTVSAVARLAGASRNTVKKYLREGVVTSVYQE